MLFSRQPTSTTDTVIKDIKWSKITNESELTYLEMNTAFVVTPDYYKDRITLWDQLVPHSSSSYKIQPTILLSLLSLVFVFINF